MDLKVLSNADIDARRKRMVISSALAASVSFGLTWLSASIGATYGLQPETASALDDMGGAFLSVIGLLFAVLFSAAGLVALLHGATRLVTETSRLSSEGAQELMKLCARHREVEQYRTEILNSGRDLLNIDLHVAQDWVESAPQRTVMQSAAVAG